MPNMLSSSPSTGVEGDGCAAGGSSSNDVAVARRGVAGTDTDPGVPGAAARAAAAAAAVFEAGEGTIASEKQRSTLTERREGRAGTGQVPGRREDTSSYEMSHARRTHSHHWPT